MILLRMHRLYLFVPALVIVGFFGFAIAPENAHAQHLYGDPCGYAAPPVYPTTYPLTPNAYPSLYPSVFPYSYPIGLGSFGLRSPFLFSDSGSIRSSHHQHRFHGQGHRGGQGGSWHGQGGGGHRGGGHWRH